MPLDRQLSAERKRIPQSKGRGTSTRRIRIEFPCVSRPGSASLQGEVLVERLRAEPVQQCHVIRIAGGKALYLHEVFQAGIEHVTGECKPSQIDLEVALGVIVHSVSSNRIRFE